MRSSIRPVPRIMVEVVHRYEGYVVRTTGDGIFALFGAPVAHEDHPLRALSAALRLQQELRAHGQRRIAQGLHPLEARVGVHTGEVVAQSVETDGKAEYRLVGHTANLAARMEVVAPTGSIAASEYTRKLCEGYFTFKPLGPMTVKGVSEPVAVYEVIGLGPLRTRFQRATARGLTKFVGREREMEALRHVAELVRQGHGQIVAAMAEPGVGKSRLYFEFKATSQTGWMVLETFSISHGKASAYFPVLDLLQGYFKVASRDDERTRREKVAGRLAMLDSTLEDTRPYLFSLLGIVEGADPLAQMDGQLKKRRTLEAIKRILLRESLNQPLMMIFEDLHWIDEATQEFLNLLADVARYCEGFAAGDRRRLARSRFRIRDPHWNPLRGPQHLSAFQGVPEARRTTSDSLHDLRHSAASLMLAQSIPLRSIQEILGHSSIAITANLYAQVGEQLKRDAADAMDAIFGAAGSSGA
jgi:hypothetical protein